MFRLAHRWLPLWMLLALITHYVPTIATPVKTSASGTDASAVSTLRPVAIRQTSMPPATFTPAPLRSQPLEEQLWSAMSQAPGTAQAEETLLSRHKHATASSSMDEVGYSDPLYPYDANDGMYDSFWAAAKTAPGWWQVDLGYVYPITKVSVFWYGPGFTYNIQASEDGQTFRSIISSRRANSEVTTDLVSTRTRYIRINIIGNNIYGHGPMIREADVYGILSVPKGQDGPTEECPCDPQKEAGDPFNTRTGVLWESFTDLAVHGDGPDLTWVRSYISEATGTVTAPFGFGWQHTFATRLISGAQTALGGEPGLVIIRSPKGNLQRFQALVDGSFRAFPGIYSTLVRNPTTGVYTQTLRTQEQFIFAPDGMLQATRDTQGRELRLILQADGKLRIQDQTNTQRYLLVEYNAARTQILRVSDATGRSVGYEYNASGDLVKVVDVMGHTTTYTYQNHLLIAIHNALNQRVMQTAYDVYTPAGKVISQTLQSGQQLTLQYLPSTTTITTTTPGGQQEVTKHHYGADDTITAITRNESPEQAFNYDAQFAPGTVADGNGNTTTTAYNIQGLPVTTTDALGQQTRVEYDDRNRPISTTDSLGRQAISAYDNYNNLISHTTGITTEFPLGFTTIYTYTSDKLRLEEQQTPDGIVTRYDYTLNTGGGIATRTTRRGFGTLHEQATREEYDALGRRIRTVVGADPVLARRDETIYNADNTIAKTIQNYKNGVFDAAYPDRDIETRYGYDALSRQVWVRNTLGSYDLTHYNTKGQVDWTLRNWQPVVLNANQQPLLPSTPPAYDPAQPDANVATLYTYDGLGRTTFVTQTGILTGTFDPQTQTFSSATPRVTGLEYDDRGRPIRTTLNYKDGVFDANRPDEDVTTESTYDAAGNVIGQKDALGRWTYTQYDVLNRPVKVTHNYENGDPLTVSTQNSSWATPLDTDLITFTKYRHDGQIERTINNYVDGTFTATEPITDRITLFEYDTLSRVITTTIGFDPTPPADPNNPRTDTNQQSVTAYDPHTGRTTGSRDTLGRWTSYQYDGLGRVQTTIQNCRSASGLRVVSGCATFDPQLADRNVPAQTRYDVLGRAFEMVNALGHITRTTFDGLGRTTATTQNYQDGTFAPARSDEDVITRTAYDGLGYVRSRFDALGAENRTAYNALGQAVSHTDPALRVTTNGYDGTGALRWAKSPNGQVSFYEIDGLGRPIASIVNYADGIASTTDPADRDLVTRTVYDVAGRKVKTIDAAGRVTAFGYNLQDHLIWVQENVRADCADPALAAKEKPCNVLTQYKYDRAGNRTAIIDAKGQRRSFTYDSADRQTAATDALGQVTQRQYDQNGQVTKQIDPRGVAYNVTYTYDEVDRQTGVSAPSLAVPTSITYDALGRRKSMTDTTGTTSFVPDALGRITEVTAPQTGTVGYRYDARGQRTQLMYPGGSTINYSYWPDGQLQNVSQATASLASYTYDPAGRLQEVTRGNGTQTSYTFDEANRLSQIRTVQQSDDALLGQYQYTLDRTGQRIAVMETTKQMNSALQFQSDDEMNRASIGRPRTIEFWVRPSSANQWSTLVSESGTAHSSIELRNGKVHYVVPYSSGDGEWIAKNTQVTLAAGTWYHVAVTFSGLQYSNVTVYVNGTAGQSTIMIGSQGTTLHIGGGMGFAGQLDEIRFSSSVRYSGAFAPPASPFSTDTSTMALYHLDEGSGQYARDSSGNSYDLRLGTSDSIESSDPTWVVSQAPTSRTQATQSITYRYDGLGRLTDAVESPGTTYRYAYDLAGNRTDLWTNGTLTEHREYNAANQVNTWHYDAAGNLLNDGTAAYTYDALGRLTQLTQGGVQATNSYNADGVLVAQTAGTSTTIYTPDLILPLSQILQATQGTARTNYVYGHERLFATDGTSTRTWYGSDALGSVRQTFNNSGTPLSALRYDPWGTPKEGPPPTFGFTGELQNATGLTYLRARWYQPGHGRFLSHDPFSGFDTLPYSLHQYQYGYSDPVARTDASGRCPAPVGMAGGVICVDLFIQAAQLGGGLAEGDGRSFDANSNPQKSRAYVYIPVDNRGRMRGQPQSFVNDSCTVMGCFKAAGAPYNQWHIAQASSTGWISVRWENFLNAASVAALEWAEKSRELGFGQNACLVEVGTKTFAPPAIDGELVLGRNPRGMLDWVSYDRDPFPSLEVYYYEDGQLQYPILQRHEEWPANFGLSPFAPNDVDYNMAFKSFFPHPEPGPMPQPAS